MSLYDEVHVGERVGQVKLWRNVFKGYGLGDSVAPVYGLRDYDVVMREGGYVHVRDLRITGWDDENEVACFDKWGGYWVGNRENIGEVGEEIDRLTGHRSSYFTESEND